MGFVIFGGLVLFVVFWYFVQAACFCWGFLGVLGWFLFGLLSFFVSGVCGVCCFCFLLFWFWLCAVVFLTVLGLGFLLLFRFCCVVAFVCYVSSCLLVIGFVDFCLWFCGFGLCRWVLFFFCQFPSWGGVLCFPCRVVVFFFFWFVVLDGFLTWLFYLFGIVVWGVFGLVYFCLCLGGWIDVFFVVLFAWVCGFVWGFAVWWVGLF